MTMRAINPLNPSNIVRPTVARVQEELANPNRVVSQLSAGFGSRCYVKIGDGFWAILSRAEHIDGPKVVLGCLASP